MLPPRGLLKRTGCLIAAYALYAAAFLVAVPVMAVDACARWSGKIADTAEEFLDAAEEQ